MQPSRNSALHNCITDCVSVQVYVLSYFWGNNTSTQLVRKYLNCSEYGLGGGYYRNNLNNLK